ncbi:MAG TPA: type II secretion system minor pseudopilin GspK [Steroidobacteraceae bacterium]|nr:type II secretion system minor pseudopilin GspK [Steroidobacteraceae bacterium]
MSAARPRCSRAQRQRRRPPPRAQRGIALLVAVLLVALGTILAAAIAYENAMTARRGTATYAFDQSLLIQQGAEALAAYGLRQIRQSDPTHTYPGQGWDKPYGPLEVVPGIMLEASLEDLQGRLNINNLVNHDGTPNQDYVGAFTQLLAMLGLEPKWAGFLIDWIDADIVPQNPDGAEDSVYMGQTPPYRTPNRYITSISELLALPGFGRDRYLLLAPYVTALPWGTKINVCTAKDKVLDAFLGAGHSEFSADAGALAKNRSASSGCFPTLANYQAAFDPKKWQKSMANYFAQSSSYFRLTSFITIGSTEFNLYSLLYQDPTNSVRPIQRSFTPE